MNIYAVKPDTSYQMMYPEDEVYSSENWEFKASPLIEKLPKQFKGLYDDDTKKPKPDIAYLGMKTFAFRKDVATELVDILEAAGELLPFWVDGELWYCLNVLESANTVDEEKSEWRFNDGKTKMGLKKIAFIESKLPSKTSLFKVPTDNHTTIYCVDRRDTDSEVLNNFFCAIAAHGYTGIEFEQVYP